MALKETINDDKKLEMYPEVPRKTTKSYASKVFQESSVGVVASIAHTTSKRRRVYKVIAFSICLFGFLYQSGKFLMAVLEYPTSVGIDIIRPDILTVPGFTFCDNNEINRRIFCEKFPDRCEKPSEAFCEKYGSYCGVNKTLVPKKEYYEFPNIKPLSVLKELNVEMEDFAKVIRSKKSENMTGPYLRVREDTESSLLCYSLYERINNSLLPAHVDRNRISRAALTTLEFRVRDDETFMPGNEPGIVFSVHSPYEAVNPFEFGYFMKPGKRYMIFVSTEAEVLLPEPYSTKCVNYTEIWDKNGRTGPRLQEMCKQNCVAEISLKCYNCVVPQFIFGKRERYCTPRELEDDNCPVDAEEQWEKCHANCRDDCRQTKFTYTVQERFIPHFTQDGHEIENLDNIIKVDVYLEGDEIVVLKHSPKYMFVEVFSNIGGFIGCWLGINLLDITDIVENFFRIIRYSMKKL